MVPLYVYPGAAWDTIAASANSVSTVAIINPNSGPGTGPNSDYVTYMQKMVNAGVVMVGYVHTSYGARALADVKADIDVYATQFPHVTGIFLDEASASSSDIAYYTSLYQYIMSMPGYNYDILNPGIIPDQGYYSISTQIVALENYGTSVASQTVPSWGSCANKDHFVAIVHTTASGSMPTYINSLNTLGYFGWVYVTDGAGGCCTYNALTSYYATEASYIANTIN